MDEIKWILESSSSANLVKVPSKEYIILAAFLNSSSPDCVNIPTSSYAKSNSGFFSIKETFAFYAQLRIIIKKSLH